MSIVIYLRKNQQKILYLKNHDEHQYVKLEERVGAMFEGLDLRKKSAIMF